jgi:O-antigen ligase
MVNTYAESLLSGSRRTILLVIAAALLLALPLIFFTSAEVTMVVLVACLLGAIMFLKPEFTTLVVIFVFYTNLSVVGVRNGIPELFAASFFLLLGLPLFYILVVQKQRFIVNSVVIMMVVYLSLMLLSAAMSAQPNSTFSRINNFLIEGLILYVLILNCFRNTEMIRKAIWVLILAGGFIGALSVYQSATGDYANDFGGLAQASNAAINAGPESFLGQQRTVTRLAGPIGEKNRYAQMMVVLLPLAISRIVAERSPRLKLLAALCGMMILGGTFLTFSRGAGIAVIVIFVAMAALRIFDLRYWLLMAIGIPLLMLVFAPDYFERLSTLGEVSTIAEGTAGEADGSLLGRATENIGTLMIFLDHPLFGVGPGQTIRYIRAAGNEVGLRHLNEDRRAHNMYLEELADTGILGFAAFMSIVGITVVRLWQQARYWKSRNNDYFQTLAGLLMAVLAYMTTAFFLHLSYARYYWFLLAIAGAAIHVFSETARSTEKENPDELAEQNN